MATTEEDPNMQPVPADPNTVPLLDPVNLFDLPPNVFEKARIVKVVPMKLGGVIISTNVQVACPPSVSKFGAEDGKIGECGAKSRSNYMVDAKGQEGNLQSITDQAIAFLKKTWGVAFAGKPLGDLDPATVSATVDKNAENYAKWAPLEHRSKITWPRIYFKEGYGCAYEVKRLGDTSFRTAKNMKMSEVVPPNSTVMCIAQVEIHFTSQATRVITAANFVRSEHGAAVEQKQAPSTKQWDHLSSLGAAFAGFSAPVATADGDTDMDAGAGAGAGAGSAAPAGPDVGSVFG